MSLLSFIQSRPRLRLADGPSPLRPLMTVEGVSVCIKHDDFGYLGSGGNKLRKLEFLGADAQALGADTLLTAGAIQSNHARLTAATAAALGMSARLLLIDLVRTDSALYRKGGNRLLSGLLGADCRMIDDRADPVAALAEHAEDLRRLGRTPYVVPFGGSNWLGSLGYVVCGLEIAQQCPEAAAVYLACGSGGTQAGLLAALQETNAETAVVGVTVLDGAASARIRIEKILDEIAEHSGGEAALPKAAIRLDESCRGDGYGQVTAEALAAIRRVARGTGVILDPVYTGKAMAAMLRDVGAGMYPAGSMIIFLHTGGLPGVFAYGEQVLGLAA